MEQPTIYHLFLSSKDSKKHFEDNTASDFTVQLPNTLHFHSGQWSCGLLDIECTKTRGVNDSFYVCADFVASSVADERRLPVLRRVSTRDAKGRSIVTTFGDVIYVPVIVKSLTLARVYIMSDGNKSSPFAQDTDLKCTLRFIAS